MIDAEHAFDRAYAESLGVDTENLLISQPDNGEQALEIADNLIRSGAIDLHRDRQCGGVDTLVRRSKERWVTAQSACRPG
jgi:RecA/RadA recombinase